MAYVRGARHLLRAKDLAYARYFERLDVGNLARAAGTSAAPFAAPSARHRTRTC